MINNLKRINELTTEICKQFKNWDIGKINETINSLNEYLTTDVKIRELDVYGEHCEICDSGVYVIFDLMDLHGTIEDELKEELEKTPKTSKLKREVLELKIEIERQKFFKYEVLVELLETREELEKYSEMETDLEENVKGKTIKNVVDEVLASAVPSPETKEIDTVPKEQISAVPKIYNEVRGLKMIFNRGGGGGVSTKVSIPISYSRTIGVTEDSRDIEIELVNDSYITIRKKRLK